MGVVARVHGEYVFARRIRVLAESLAPLLPEGGTVLDVGCGDGQIDRLIGLRRPDLRIEGIDVLVRPETHVPVTPFDGRRIPFPDRSFDAVMFVDVLHHTDDPLVLLAEAARVTRGSIVIKDHCRDGLLAGPTLRFMDWVGNARHGVALPYNYWPERRWRDAFGTLGLRIARWEGRVDLYPWPASLVFGRGLHFVARLETG
ncbi:class I SAM-dependent methyltransferase [Falsiroseomonas oryzae]|uniref:class I SAM-dependent methyltransferase n=1 Tax=Falsiroseomonas oryzae TaxID=2766473 RepID=UPI0022EB3849|nr:class I SAM-dependent methyltransferase [Roseomonas sp. MO-31]